MGASCSAFRGDSEPAHESGPRGHPRSRNRRLAGSNPQSANAQSAKAFARGAQEAKQIEKCKIASG
eukprot:2297044-Alexandrium_andersonii.AAC.1